MKNNIATHEIFLFIGELIELIKKVLDGSILFSISILYKKSQIRSKILVKIASCMNMKHET